uniref:Endonuclease/exonuclease/phosphatase domain-containing protein n=1 Tax=Triticum urartu TaxID=4572 RepID=A0A8R7K0T9_TRIUA
MWEGMKRLKAQDDLPWLVVGDFNEVLWDYEHLSETPRSHGQMIAFRDVLEACDLSDLGFSG